MKLFRRQAWASLAPGRFVDVGTQRLHISCAGHGTPTVVFDSALAGSVLSWIFIQPEVATFTQTCSYDRAGHGWSEAGPMPRTLSRSVDELHTLLQRAKVPPPFVLVGHSYGGLVAQLYISRYPDEVAGIVLVDSAHAKDWAHANEGERARLETGIRLCRRGASVTRFGVGRVVSSLVSVGALAVARGLTSALSGGALAGQHEE